MDARDTLSRSDSQRKSKGSRRGQRSGNDLFVCFAPRTSLNLVSRPVLSPSRDKGKESGRRGKALSSSIFAKGAKKQGYEGEEPTSPKVTCIGQVRVKHKKGQSRQDVDALRKSKQRMLKSSSEVGSPGRSNGQVKADASKKEQNTSACSNFGKDFSCFGLPCDSYGSLPSFRGDKKSCGAVFAKSLVLIQESDVKRETKGNAEKRIDSQTSEGHRPDEREVSPTSLSLRVDEDEQIVPAEIPPDLNPTEARDSNVGHQSNLTKREEQISEPEEEEQDTFEPEPPPPNALLLMRRKVEHLRVVVPPPSVNITLKRSTSAPAQCRVERSSEGDCKQSEDFDSLRKDEHPEIELDKSSGESTDLPKRTSPTNVQKSFLKRCKSVSQSLTRTNGLQDVASAQHDTTVEEKAKPETDLVSEVKEIEESPAEANCIPVSKAEEEQVVLEFVNAASRKRSESEAPKVSLDMVPETWLWQTCTIVRPPKDSLNQEREKRSERQGAEWLDAELEASLWKSCKVAESLKNMESTTSQETGAEWLDAEVEATLWRSCRAAGASLWRSSSVGNQNTEQERRGSTELKRESSESNTEKPGRDSNASQKCDMEEQNCSEEATQSYAICIVENIDEPENHKVNEQEGEMEKQFLHEKSGEFADSTTLNLQEEISLREAPAPASTPAPPTTADTLLILRYNLGALRISLDPSDTILTDAEKSIDTADHQQQKARIKTMSHFHDVGSCARLLKAASGKEAGSLSSAFRLQRCKSEPVRLTT